MHLTQQTEQSVNNPEQPYHDQDDFRPPGANAPSGEWRSGSECGEYSDPEKI